MDIVFIICVCLFTAYSVYTRWGEFEPLYHVAFVIGVALVLILIQPLHAWYGYCGALFAGLMAFLPPVFAGLIDEVRTGKARDREWQHIYRLLQDDQSHEQQEDDPPKAVVNARQGK